jgi:TfoX/Sxy family transcriptional regulator of competence genes
MSYDEALADRIRRSLGPRPDVTEKKMFGGLAFLLGGKMFCGIVKGELMVRVGPERYAAALAQPHVRPMDFTGRPMEGYVYVAASGAKTEKGIRRWVEHGVAFVTTLEGGATKKRRKPRAGKR